MHTMTTKLPEGGEACIHHNGDWSGEAYVSWDDADGHHEVKRQGLEGVAVPLPQPVGRVRLVRAPTVERHREEDGDLLAHP